jgi:hypothetical protein
MEQIRLTNNEAIVYITVFNILLGIVLGLIPLILGFVKKERSYGVFGFLGSIIGGAILGLFLSVPIMAIFTWLILRRPKNIVAPDAANANPANSTVEKPNNL